MALIFNSQSPTSVVYNGSAVTRLIYNNTEYFHRYYDNGAVATWFGGFNSYAITGLAGSVTFFSTYINISAGFQGGTGANERSISTANSVNLTGINTLYITWDGQVTNGTSQFSAFIVGTNPAVGFSTFTSRIILNTQDFSGPITSSLDVSGLTGNYFIRVHQRDSSTSSLTGGQIQVYRIWGS
jgi:hypothetical protein